MDPREVAIVSGLPRSGTSMMMRMIVTGGIPALSDGLRAADEDNPLGYFELEAVKTTKKDPSWLDGAPGKVVKLVHILLPDLPLNHSYRVVMLHRNPDEVIASQQKMLDRSGKKGAQLPAAALKNVFNSQMESVRRWLDSHSNFKRLDVHYDRVIADPMGEAARVAEFLGISDMAGKMAAAVDPKLYRNRK